MAASFIALEHTSVVNLTLILALQPALVIAAAKALFGERCTRAQVVASRVAVSGVAAVVVGSQP